VLGFDSAEIQSAVEYPHHHQRVWVSFDYWLFVDVAPSGADFQSDSITDECGAGSVDTEGLFSPGDKVLPATKSEC